MMQLVDALNKAVANGDRESMFRRADELGRYFYETVLDVFKDFDAAWMRFKMAESMVAFLVSIGEVGQAVVLRNRIIAHYQHIRKLKGYTASQKHELKAILGLIRAVIPPVSWRERYGHRPLNDEERQQIFVLRAYRWFAEVHKMLPQEGMKYLKPFGIESFFVLIADNDASFAGGGGNDTILL